MRNIIIVIDFYNFEEWRGCYMVGYNFVIILDTIDFFNDLIVLLLSLRIPIRTEKLADLKWGNI